MRTTTSTLDPHVQTRLRPQHATPAPGPRESRGAAPGQAPLWSAAREMTAAHAKEFFKRWRKVAEGFDAEDIHDLRVASRRLREALALFGDCFPEKSVRRIRKRVKQVTGILGELRNTDEALLFFNGLSPAEREPAQTELDLLVAQLQKEREAARQQLEKDLGDLRATPLKRAIREGLSAPELFGNQRTDPFQPLVRFADEAIAARALSVADLLPQALFEANAGAQHRLRIAVKRLRYRLEILEPLFTSEYDLLHAALKGYQEVLGKLHDLDVFAELALNRVADGTGQQQVLRVITARRSRLFAEFRHKLDDISVDAIGTRARRAL
ncbi:CHAD domain-containing protein [Geomonas limicola]|uniref:CHAD domain-containing protein n=1 Tax=Geomonas limicola TaxID=2740186 RepID=A0A6V8NBE9_9BACT|nr:CHAD domain-containing protein [Geomonas limicola]GFO69770.1 CHAD domain-containing protein [Geomonas limicola]